jgi:hypothetical protein
MLPFYHKIQILRGQETINWSGSICARAAILFSNTCMPVDFSTRGVQNAKEQNGFYEKPPPDYSTIIMLPEDNHWTCLRSSSSSAPAFLKQVQYSSALYRVQLFLVLKQLVSAGSLVLGNLGI